MSFAKSFISHCATALNGLDLEAIDAVAGTLKNVRDSGGRLFLIGSGGGAGHSSHAVCDFRKLCNIEAYAPYDNVSELTARINDEGWDTTLVEWLKVSKFSRTDCLFVFSVGGGNKEKNISMNIVRAVEYADQIGAGIVGVVGKDGGYTGKMGKTVLIPTVDSELITPITEGFQALIWHLLVSHPFLKVNNTKWESVMSLSHKDESKNKNTVKTKLFADGANKDAMLALYKNPSIEGFTTNPTLMRKAGIRNYREFALDILKVIKDKPISFEVFADEFDEMELQAKEIASWGGNVYVKIPITNTKAQSAVPLIARLSESEVKINVTAVMTVEQVEHVLPALSKCPAAFISVFAGRIADTGVDPMPIMKKALQLVEPYSHVELLWASPREVLNYHQANEIGCHVITATDDIIKKLSLSGKDHNEYSLDTVKMFYDDAKAAGYSIELASSISTE